VSPGATTLRTAWWKAVIHNNPLAAPNALAAPAERGFPSPDCPLEEPTPTAAQEHLRASATPELDETLSSVRFLRSSLMLFVVFCSTPASVSVSRRQLPGASYTAKFALEHGTRKTTLRALTRSAKQAAPTVVPKPSA